MEMKNQEERHFKVSLTHEKNYQFLSQASEDGARHGAPYVSDEPDPVGEASGPATPALLASAIGHCLSAALLEKLKTNGVEVHSIRTEADAVVHLGDAGLPRIKTVNIEIIPDTGEMNPETKAIVDTFQNHCTVTCSVKQGIGVNVGVTWPEE